MRVISLLSLLCAAVYVEGGNLRKSTVLKEIFDIFTSYLTRHFFTSFVYIKETLEAETLSSQLHLASETALRK